MELFLLRHGSAHTTADKDSERTLDAIGREEVSRNLSGNSDALAGVTQLLVSPYARAQQTADIAQSLLHFDTLPKRQTVDFLTPCGNPQHLIDHLYQHNYSSVLCVSHQPLLGTILDEICGFEPGQYRLSTGTLVCIEFSEVIAKGLGVLKWLKHP